MAPSLCSAQALLLLLLLGQSFFFPSPTLLHQNVWRVTRVIGKITAHSLPRLNMFNNPTIKTDGVTRALSRLTYAFQASGNPRAAAAFLEALEEAISSSATELGSGKIDSSRVDGTTLIAQSVQHLVESTFPAAAPFTIEKPATLHKRQSSVPQSEIQDAGKCNHKRPSKFPEPSECHLQVDPPRARTNAVAQPDPHPTSSNRNALLPPASNIRVPADFTNRTGHISVGPALQNMLHLMIAPSFFTPVDTIATTCRHTGKTGTPNSWSKIQGPKPNRGAEGVSFQADGDWVTWTKYGQRFQRARCQAVEKDGRERCRLFAYVKCPPCGVQLCASHYHKSTVHKAGRAREDGQNMKAIEGFEEEYLSS